MKRILLVGLPVLLIAAVCFGLVQAAGQHAPSKSIGGERTTAGLPYSGSVFGPDEVSPMRETPPLAPAPNDPQSIEVASSDDAGKATGHSRRLQLVHRDGRVAALARLHVLALSSSAPRKSAPRDIAEIIELVVECGTPCQTDRDGWAELPTDDTCYVAVSTPEYCTLELLQKKRPGTVTLFPKDPVTIRFSASPGTTPDYSELRAVAMSQELPVVSTVESVGLEAPANAATGPSFGVLPLGRAGRDGTYTIVSRQVLAYYSASRGVHVSGIRFSAPGFSAFLPLPGLQSDTVVQLPPLGFGRISFVDASNRLTRITGSLVIKEGQNSGTLEHTSYGVRAGEACIPLVRFDTQFSAQLLCSGEPAHEFSLMIPAGDGRANVVVPTARSIKLVVSVDDGTTPAMPIHADVRTESGILTTLNIQEATGPDNRPLRGMFSVQCSQHTEGNLIITDARGYRGLAKVHKALMEMRVHLRAPKHVAISVQDDRTNAPVDCEIVCTDNADLVSFRSTGKGLFLAQLACDSAALVVTAAGYATDLPVNITAGQGQALISLRRYVPVQVDVTVDASIPVDRLTVLFSRDGRDPTGRGEPTVVKGAHVTTISYTLQVANRVPLYFRVCSLAPPAVLSAGQVSPANPERVDLLGLLEVAQFRDKPGIPARVFVLRSVGDTYHGGSFNTAEAAVSLISAGPWLVLAPGCVPQTVSRLSEFAAERALSAKIDQAGPRGHLLYDELGLNTRVDLLSEAAPWKMTTPSTLGVVLGQRTEVGPGDPVLLLTRKPPRLVTRDGVIQLVVNPPRLFVRG